MKYWMITYVNVVPRIPVNENVYHTVLDCSKSPFNFIMIQRELGRNVHLVNALEITDEQYHQGNKIMHGYEK